MKYIIVLCDGMSDRPIKSLNNQTLLQYARTPNMDLLASLGRTGQLLTIPAGFDPGSEVANISILGYDLSDIHEGRAAFEAVGSGVELQNEDLVLRCNLINIEGDFLKNHTAGYITTEEAEVLITYLQEHLGNDRIRFYSGKQFRHLVVIKEGDKRVECTPPHEVPFKPYSNYLSKAITIEAKETASLINDLMSKSQKLLADHPINQDRISKGKVPANAIWLWSPSHRAKIKPLSEIYPAIQKGSVVSATDLIKGIGVCAGLHSIKVEGATGLYDTNYKNKLDAALDALVSDDFVYLHIEACDEAGHAGDAKTKLLSIENIDKQIVGPLYEALKSWETPVSIAILPDHSTPCEIRIHTSDPVPFLIYYPGIVPDNVQKFDELECAKGSYGVLKGNQFMNEFLRL